MIDLLDKSKPVPDPDKTRVIYLAVDPAGGGKSELSFFGLYLFTIS